MAPECRQRKQRPHLLFSVGFYFYFICNLLREVGNIISSQHLHKSNSTVRSLVMCTDKYSRNPFRDNRNYQWEANISVAFFTLVASVTFPWLQQNAWWAHHATRIFSLLSLSLSFVGGNKVLWSFCLSFFPSFPSGLIGVKGQQVFFLHLLAFIFILAACLGSLHLTIKVLKMN